MTIVFDVWCCLTSLWLLFITFRSFTFVRNLPVLADVPIGEQLGWPKISILFQHAMRARRLKPPPSRSWTWTIPTSKLFSR